MSIRNKKMPKEQMTSFKNLSFSEKVSYIFGYYKYHMLAVVIVGIIIASCVYFYQLNNYDAVCHVVVVDGRITGYEDGSDGITKGFTNHLGIDGTSTRVEFDYNYSLIQRPLDQEASISADKIYILASTGSMDGYMANIDYIDYFTKDNQLFLCDLRDILTADELAAIGEENIIYYTKEDKTTYPVAVNLTNTKIKTGTDLSIENPCYGVVVTAPNHDNAVEFIRYAFDLK